MALVGHAIYISAAVVLTCHVVHLARRARRQMQRLHARRLRGAADIEGAIQIQHLHRDRQRLQPGTVGKARVPHNLRCIRDHQRLDSSTAVECILADELQSIGEGHGAGDSAAVVESARPDVLQRIGEFEFSSDAAAPGKRARPDVPQRIGKCDLSSGAAAPGKRAVADIAQFLGNRNAPQRCTATERPRTDGRAIAQHALARDNLNVRARPAVAAGILRIDPEEIGVRFVAIIYGVLELKRRIAKQADKTPATLKSTDRFIDHFLQQIYGQVDLRHSGICGYCIQGLDDFDRSPVFLENLLLCFVSGICQRILERLD